MLKKLSRLDYFTLNVMVSLYELRNGSLVAQRLKASQPKVSRALASLRQAFDNELFIREQYGVIPNAFAESLYPLARDVVGRYDEIGLLLSKQQTHVVLNIAAQEHFTDLIVSSVADVAEILKQDLSVNISPWSESVKQLAAVGKLDYAITTSPIALESTMSYPLFAMGDIFLIGRKGHPIFDEALSLEKVLCYKQVLISHLCVDMPEHWLETSAINNNVDIKVSFKTSCLVSALRHISTTDDLCWAESILAYDNVCDDQDIEILNATDFVRSIFPINPQLDTAYSLLSFNYNSELSQLLANAIKLRVDSIQISMRLNQACVV